MNYFQDQNNNDPGGDDGASFGYNLPNHDEAEEKFKEDMEEAIRMKETIRALHVDALVECDHTFIDQIDRDRTAIDRCKEYEKAIDFMELCYPSDEPIRNLAAFVEYHRAVFMPMLRSITNGK